MDIFVEVDGRRIKLQLCELIGNGKQGDVYRICDNPDLCAKIYRDLDNDVSAHLNALTMIDASEWYLKEERHLEVAWPLAACQNAAGETIGFLMNVLSDRYFPALDLFDVGVRERWRALNWGFLLGVAADLARMVAKLHDRGILVGDIALQNMMASAAGRVSLLDCDSFVLRLGWEKFGGVTWRRDNSPPEGGSGRHTRETDYFSLAVVICQLLMEQYHPFGGIDTSADSDDRDEVANIARGRSWLFHGSIRTPPMCPPREQLPAPARDLAYLAFEQGTENPAARPPAVAWYDVLVGISRNLQRCQVRQQHVFYAVEWTSCPWCERRERQAGHDPFPSRPAAPASPAWLHLAGKDLHETVPIPKVTPAPKITEFRPVGRKRDAVPAADPPVAKKPPIKTSKREANEHAWEKLEKIKADDGFVMGMVTEVVPGGLILDIGLRGFLPASKVDTGTVTDLDGYLGSNLKVKVILLDRKRENVVLSRRAWLEQDQAATRRAVLESLTDGQIRTGTVSSITNFGAFVDLGGLDGLVHVSELSWTHVGRPRDVVEVGQELRVKVLSVDTGAGRVSLSLKQTAEDPFQTFVRLHKIGDVVPGRVVKTVSYGAFVRLDGGIDGLVHVSELADQLVKDPGQVVTVDDKVYVKVIDIDADRRRISLSMKMGR